MGNKNGAVILLVILMISAFLLGAWELSDRFARRRGKRVQKKGRPDELLHMLAPSLLGLCLCAVCLCGASWAWFTATATTGTSTIQSATFQLGNVTLTPQESSTAPTYENGKYTLEPGKYTLTLQTSGTATTGYCRITVTPDGEGAETAYYYTTNLKTDATAAFTINTGSKITVQIEAIWGDVANRAPAGTLMEDSTLTIGDFTSTGDAATPANGSSSDADAAAPAEDAAPDASDTADPAPSDASDTADASQPEADQPDSASGESQPSAEADSAPAGDSEA